MSQTMQSICDKMESRLPALLEEWHLPGVSIALVQDGKVVFTGARGSRDLAGNLPMTAHTHLPIGSVTKSFTALALGMLADEGKLDWDKPVCQYIPWLKLSDPVAQQQATARDLMCHRTGMAKYDAHAVFCTKDDRKAMVEDLQYLDFSVPFRSVLQYSNQMVMLAGFLVETLSGMSWEDFVQQRILDPLGMKDTSFYAEKLDEVEDHARGYLFDGTACRQTDYLPLRGVAPAGGICSNAEDMARFVAFQLGDGSWEGRRLISREQLVMMHTPQMDGTPYFWQFPEFSETKYGLGWFTDVYRGVPMVSHGGNTLGFSSLVTLLPEQKAGIVLLTNGNSNFMIYPMTYSMVDDLLGASDAGWDKRFQKTIAGVFAAMAEGQKAMAAMQIPGTAPSHPLEEYTGTFTHPAFGTLALHQENGQLSGTLNGFPAALTHFHYDVFNLVLPTMGLTLPAQFGYGLDGKISTLQVTFEPTPGVSPVCFKKA